MSPRAKKTADPSVDPAVRHEFVLLFDVTDGNPNGDPDAGNSPRMDPETRQGIVTDVSTKRKVRDYVLAARGGEDPFNIYVQHGVALSARHREIYEENKLKKAGSKGKGVPEDVETARKAMCRRYYDIRMFGAVLSVGLYPAGRVTGPVQLAFGRSVDPILALENTITRVAVTREEDLAALAAGEGGKEQEMGSKMTVPYGLYRQHGFFSPGQAAGTGVTTDDMNLLWEALLNGWEVSRSASRGEMNCRGLYVFTHESALGNAPSAKTLGAVTVDRNPAVATPRHFTDYKVTADPADVPAGVTLTTYGV